LARGGEDWKQKLAELGAGALANSKSLSGGRKGSWGVHIGFGREISKSDEIDWESRKSRGKGYTIRVGTKTKTDCV